MEFRDYFQVSPPRLMRASELQMQRNELQIETFWNISLLTIESLFFRFLKIFLAYFHSAFSQSKHTSFRTNGLDIGTTELIPALDELFQIHLYFVMRRKKYTIPL